MASGNFIWTNISILLLSLASTLVMIFNVDPFEAKLKTIIFFGFSIFLAVASIASLVGFGIRFNRGAKYEAKKYMMVSTRQGVLIGMAIVGLLILKAMDSLYVWDGILLVVSVLLIELYFKR